MNGIHDMGGMQDMGPVRIEKNEPVFHASWEGRAFALLIAVGVENGRWLLESLPPVDYLRMSYYERWLTVTETFVVRAGLVTLAEMESGKVMRRPAKRRHVLTAADVTKSPIVTPAAPQSKVIARFHVGQQVRARNMSPIGHTRSPRYTRGRVGTIERDGGVQMLEDTVIQDLGEKRQHVYSVRFAARELWGEKASPHDSVYVDMWEGYLEPA